ncbi:hypothetical protein BS78_01G370600 [Paspalum vaginatum]|nr:hypothetical protein BS78_01G370600 [Paspalum vaginatum]
MASRAGYLRCLGRSPISLPCRAALIAANRRRPRQGDGDAPREKAPRGRGVDGHLAFGPRTEAATTPAAPLARVAGDDRRPAPAARLPLAGQPDRAAAGTATWPARRRGLIRIQGSNAEDRDRSQMGRGAGQNHVRTALTAF